ncbi:MAG: 4-(cytidine 5'-diphospho)-2-C-methyl-D-erythritol kinase [Desulfobacterales bacterium]|jgi:4-diphosphocytidyl-2-C-methyl-D-erythritol kinase
MKILSPAKINFFLHVRGKRPDGYHELFSLMCRINLFDNITLQIGGTHEDGVEIYCSHPEVPADATNLAYQAARLFQRQLNTVQGVKIHLEKHIPVGAGLGGGSSNAASVLLALNTYYGHPFSPSDLMEMGLKLGADVPFFIFQKPAIATGVGEKLEAFEGDLQYHILLLYPGFSVSTAAVYQNLNLGLTKDKKKPTSNHLKPNRFNLADHLTNDLEQFTALKYPEIGLAKEKLLKLGAVGALMSGSGPTVFGLFDNTDTAKAARQTLSGDNVGKGLQLFLADPILDADFKLIDL